MGKHSSVIDETMDVITKTKTGYNIKKVHGKVLRNEFAKFDEGFPDRMCRTNS